MTYEYINITENFNANIMSENLIGKIKIALGLENVTKTIITRDILSLNNTIELLVYKGRNKKIKKIVIELHNNNGNNGRISYLRKEETLLGFYGNLFSDIITPSSFSSFYITGLNVLNEKDFQKLNSQDTFNDFLRILKFKYEYVILNKISVIEDLFKQTKGNIKILNKVDINKGVFGISFNYGNIEGVYTLSKDKGIRIYGINLTYKDKIRTAKIHATDTGSLFIEYNGKKKCYFYMDFFSEQRYFSEQTYNPISDLNNEINLKETNINNEFILYILNLFLYNISFQKYIFNIFDHITDNLSIMKDSQKDGKDGNVTNNDNIHIDKIIRNLKKYSV